ncbi:MAG: MFS transporter, partial [Candidatus Limnocylindrales bacterium]
MSAPPSGARPDDALERARRRATWLLVAASALASVANIAAFTVAGIAARELLGDAALAGASTTSIVLGSAVGTSVLAWLMLRSTRRRGLGLGLVVAMLGGLIAAWAVAAGEFPALLAGTTLLGFGSASTQLARYAAADMAAPEGRARAIGLVVWAGTVGAVLGPNLAPLAASFSGGLGAEELAGPFLAAALILALASGSLFLLLRPDPYELAHASSRIEPGDDLSEPMWRIVRRPRVAMAVIALVVGQVVMIGIMTMTPLHMDDHGHGLAAVGLVISAHTLGMFALSPLSGYLAARMGTIAAVLAASGLLALSAALAAVAPVDGLVLGVALFLLGYGWNLGLVAGSALLVSGVEHAERTATEGAADTLVWTASALASLSSGLIVAVLGFGALGLVGL